jgi:3-hydroxybutyryl-CoA dehydrogenase
VTQEEHVEFRKIGIVGGGSMGRSISEKLASSGIEVALLEVSAEAAAASRAALEAALDAELAKWGLTSSEKKALLSRVHIGADPAALADVDLAIESVNEDLERKTGVVRMLGELLPPDRVIVTNTSTLSITEIAAASGRPERVIGMHFMYPVPRSPIVEIVRGRETSDATLATARALAEALGKSPIEVFEYPGYVVTRAMIPFLNEAMHIVMEGVATAEDVDRALALGYDFKMGPLEYSDRVGLDKVLGWMEHMFRELGELKYRPAPLLRQLVRAGHLGRKTGRGFFLWQHGERGKSAMRVAR